MSLLQAQSAQSSDLTKMRPSVFSAISVDDFLRQYFEWRKRIQPTFSLRMLSKKLDFRSHSLLAMIVRGERNPLGPTVSSSMVQDAIERLLRSGLLEFDQQGNLKKVTLVTRTRPFITTAAMRSYQKQMLQRASVSIEAQAVSRRLFMNSMMPFNSQDTDDAKEMIAEFVEKFRTRFSSPGGDTVYLLGTHLFHITEPPATVTEPTERH
ncbi:MAG: DUF4423 domain-containing protein [Proteobacteria bacterium]|nr:DUF4423 domain-containing protein [Pseudomonadota bacterium]